MREGRGGYDILILEKVILLVKNWKGRRVFLIYIIKEFIKVNVKID